MLRLAAALLVAFLASGCATTPALFAVVPGPDGHVGRIVVHKNWWSSRVIDKAYAAERLDGEGKLASIQLTPKQVNEAFGPTLEALPGRPTSFILYFVEARDELTPESADKLEEVRLELGRRPLPDIMVIGHTDTVGGLAYNDRLSLARAQRLREILISTGIPAERIQAAGRGKRELLVPTEENVSEPRNRRVEINVR